MRPVPIVTRRVASSCTRLLLLGSLHAATTFPVGASQEHPMPSERGASSAGGESPPALTLDDVLAMAEERSPELRAMVAAADAAAERASHASTLPDPMIQLGIMNFGLPDFNTDMPTSMVPSVELMQMVPFPGKLRLAGEIADLGSDVAAARADEAWWGVRGRVADLFYELYSLDQRLEVMRETLLLLEDFQQVAKAMYASGGGRQADVLRADVEVARMDAEIRRMEAMRIATAARLNAMLDREPGAPIDEPVLGSLPRDVPGADTLIAWSRETRPALTGARLGVDQARTRTRLAHREIWPDFTVGVAYGQRDRGQGVERMGSVMLGFSLPIHAGSRQYASRDEAAAMERMAQAELDGRHAEVDAWIGELLAQRDRDLALVLLFRDEVIPEARVAVESALSAYRVGAVDFMTLVGAQMSLNSYRGELYALLADYGRTIAALESAVGRPLPRMGPALSEER